MIGHTAHFAGVARKGGEEVAFTAALDVNAGTQMVGAPFELAVEATRSPDRGSARGDGSGRERSRCSTGSTSRRSMMTATASVGIEPGSEAHNIFVRTMQSHVHYNAEAK
jgi:hypothetical protein